MAKGAGSVSVGAGGLRRILGPCRHIGGKPEDRVWASWFLLVLSSKPTLM